MKTKPEDPNAATYRQLVKVAHDVLATATPDQRADKGELAELVKRLASQRRLRYEYGRQIAAAVDSAIWQRSHAS